MSVVHAHDPALQEFARQAALRDYRLPYGGTDGAAEDRHEYEPPPELMNLVRLAVRVSGMDAGVINIITADRQHQIAAVGVEPTVCARKDSMCSAVFQSGSPTVVDDARADSRFADNPFVDGRLHATRAYTSIPLVTGHGHALGSLCVFSPRVQPLGAEAQEGLDILSKQVVEVLELQFRTRQLVEALDVVRRSNEDLAGFAARVSHDLKSPLTAILGYTELSEEDCAVEPFSPAARYFNIIRGSASRMLSTVEEVLEFSRIGGTIHRQEVRLGGLMDDVLQDLRPLSTVRDPEICVQDAELYVDRAQTAALLQNLVSNAIKYSGAGVSPRIEVVAHRGERQVLRVIDHGRGIAEEDRLRALEPLVRLHQDGDPAGSGIGLATCARIARAHDGSIALTGTPGGGTTVTVDLGPGT